jgi:hypothetical protein
LTYARGTLRLQDALHSPTEVVVLILKSLKLFYASNLLGLFPVVILAVALSPLNKILLKKKHEAAQ